jgi:hypothetical protein
MSLVAYLIYRSLCTPIDAHALLRRFKACVAAEVDLEVVAIEPLIVN